MPAVSKVGDIGIGVCPCHKSPVTYTTTFITGAGSVNTNGANTCNMSTMGISTCGHNTIVLTVSTNVNAEGSGVHRVGDTGKNCGSYVVVTGSGNVNAGG